MDSLATCKFCNHTYYKQELWHDSTGLYYHAHCWLRNHWNSLPPKIQAMYTEIKPESNKELRRTV